MSLEAQSFGASSQTAKKHFQPTKFLQDPVRVTRVTRWKKRGPGLSGCLTVFYSAMWAVDLNHQRQRRRVDVVSRQFCDAMSSRAKSATRLGLSDGPSEEFQDALGDDADAQLPRGCRRWWPDLTLPPVPAKLRKEIRQAIPRQPPRRNFAMWQMNFPAELPNGKRNPVCALGECGDPSCPTYRPKRPEVRMAVEKCILEKCQSHFKAGTLKTYASIGCGLLGQDWIVLEQLREAGLLPRRAVFVELRTARPVMTCEGAEFPRLSGAGGINLRQTGFMGDLGPEFAFSATLQFEQPIAASLIFEFCNDGQRDRIYAEAGGPEQMGSIRFGAQVGTQSHSFLVEECWDPTERQAHSFLFTVSAVGMYNVFRDGELIGRSYGFAPSTCSRKHLYVGQGHGTKLFSAFRGRIQKIKVWDQEHSKGCGGPNPGDLVPAEEVGNAHQTIAQWYKNEMDVYSFGSLAAYAAACQKDKDARFAADLLLKIDVHDELDGYDDFVCKALDANGLALTLGGPGKSWRRSGTGWLPVDMKCPVLDSAEEKVLAFWNGGPDAMDEASSAVVVRDEALALPSLNANDGVSLEELLEEVDLMATPVLETCGPSLLSQLEALERWEEDGWMDEEDELPGLVVYGR
eukprot:s404_g17.t1